MGCGGAKGYRVTAFPKSHLACLVPVLGFDPDFICVHSFAGTQVRLSEVHSLLVLACPFPGRYFLSPVSLILGWNTAQPGQTTPNCSAVTWSRFCLFFLCWQTFPPGPRPQTRGPSWSQCHPGSRGTFLGSSSSHFDCWPQPSGVSLTASVPRFSGKRLLFPLYSPHWAVLRPEDTSCSSRTPVLLQGSAGRAESHCPTQGNL